MRLSDGRTTTYLSETNVFIKNVSNQTISAPVASFVLFNTDSLWVYGENDYSPADVAPGESEGFEMRHWHNWEITGYDVRFTAWGGAEIITICVPEATGKEEHELPVTLELSQNHPNPFNPQTTIGYTLAAASHVRLVVYDTAGRKRAVLVDGYRPAGKHTVIFDAAHFASGSYLYRIVTEKLSATKAMSLVK